jgi:L-asparaginase II
MQHDAITVNVTRGGIVESRHTLHAAIVASDGTRLDTWGDVATPVYPRSAIKAMQALPMIESGAAAHFGFNQAEIALCCASHTGEPEHVSTVQHMLEKIGFQEQHLACGCHWPTYPQAAYQLSAQQRKPDQRHNNCSGKHAGMLAHAAMLKVSPEGYVGINHPIQQRIAQAMSEMCEVDYSQCAWSPDGCSAPTWAIPLDHLGLAFAKFADPSALAADRQLACKTLFDAVVKHPFMVAGTGRYCTDMMRLLGDKVFLKVGAEGVYVAAIPELKLAIALKCVDGATRAAESVMTALLDRVGITRDISDAQMAPYRQVPIKNWQTLHTGNLECQLPDA